MKNLNKIFALRQEHVTLIYEVYYGERVNVFTDGIELSAWVMSNDKLAQVLTSRLSDLPLWELVTVWQVGE